jgi:hypothetical protein
MKIFDEGGLKKGDKMAVYGRWTKFSHINVGLGIMAGAASQIAYGNPPKHHHNCYLTYVVNRR